MRYLARAELDKALINAGLTASLHGGYRWLLRREKMGLLVSPRDPATGHRKFTQQQIKDLVECFRPNGKGKYDYREYEKEK